jgi:hypothetical protein
MTQDMSYDDAFRSYSRSTTHALGMMARPLASLVLADDRAAKPFASQASDLLLPPFREEIPLCLC